MTCFTKKRLLQSVALLIMYGCATPLRAQTLNVCNKGTVTVEVVVASRRGMAVVAPYYWVIEGTSIAPGTCEFVYKENVGEYHAFIGFGFAYSQGQWGAGTVDRLPDMGSSVWGLSPHPILSKGEKNLCVRRDKTRYVLDVDNPETDCATLRLSGRGEDVGHGPFVPLAAVLYFQPEAARWYSDPILGGSWIGGQYYLNVAPKPGDHDVHASRAFESDEDRRSPEQIKADAETRKRVEEAIVREHAERERHEHVVAEYDSEMEKSKAPIHSIADFGPGWLSNGKPITARGTISRVEVKPTVVLVYFQESPGGAFVACLRRKMSAFASAHPETEGFSGNDFSSLIGKTVDVIGRVNGSVCPPSHSAGIYVMGIAQWKVH